MKTPPEERDELPPPPPSDLPRSSLEFARTAEGVQWGLVHDRPVHVLSLPDDDVDHVTCAACKWSLVPKRGPQRAWHFAHAPDPPECPLSSPESILHYNAKLELAGHLRAMSVLQIREHCKGTHLSDSSATRGRVVEWLTGWDRVAVEYPLGDVRPDIAIFSGLALIGVIEVVVSSPVGKQKEERYSEVNLPWLEVRAGVVSGWDRMTALPVHRSGPAGWECASCRVQQRLIGEDRQRWLDWLASLHRAMQEGRLVERWYKDFCVGVMDEPDPARLRVQIADIVDFRGQITDRVMLTTSDRLVLCRATGREVEKNIRFVREEFRVGLRHWRTSLEADRFRVEPKSRWTPAPAKESHLRTRQT